MTDSRLKPFLFFIFSWAVLLCYSMHAQTQNLSNHPLKQFTTAEIYKTNLSDRTLNSRVQMWALRKVAEKPSRNHRVNAILLAIALGPFGVHRLYLGTHPRVPVIYTLTLGGGLGVLPIIDIITIATTKDLDRFINNDKVIMWAH